MSRADRSTTKLSAGARVGDYVVQAELGSGGSGVVYAARHRVIGKKAAIKVLDADIRDPHANERFVQEARAVNRINHPNIVDIFAYGELADGRCYLVMERLVGETVAERLKKGPLSLEEAQSILLVVLDALAAAHAVEIVHRDLKPANIFLHRPTPESEPVVKLLDFGVAKMLRAPDIGVTPKTQSGYIVGTPAYVAPEQARGLVVDRRTDIYGLGVTAFEMLVGVRPFTADSPFDILMRQVHDPPPLVRTMRAEIPSAWERIIRDMLAKSASARPSIRTIREVLSTLELPPAPADEPARWRRFLVPALVVLGAAASVFAVVTAWSATRGSSGGPPPAVTERPVTAAGDPAASEPGKGAPATASSSTRGAPPSTLPTAFAAGTSRSPSTPSMR